MSKIQIEILMLAESMTFNGTYTLVMGEKEGNRRFSVVIGKAEAQSIAVSLDGLKATRPLTHDLFHTAFDSFNIDLLEVIITEIKEGIFYSYVVFKKGDVIIEIDSRTSDALALALRFNCPIYTNEKLLEVVGAEVDELEKQTIEQFEDELEEDLIGFDLENILDSNEFEAYEDIDLSKMMGKALENENYEYAASIRDELDRRKKKD
tara:strand:+ start:297 stop:917 length:621 start_codon:yes stop_codon:yes gene_type:complete